MISYKVALLIAALAIGGVCSTVAVNHFFFEEEDNTSTRLELYCQHFKYSKNPFPGCEASHVAD